MRRILAVAAVIAAAVALVVAVLVRPGSAGAGDYQVRALFDNAGFAVAGEQVRIAGAPVGTITDLAVTPNNLAAVTMSISDSGFAPWYANARCTIRPQSLIAERYVDCTPGSSTDAPLSLIRSGPGAGSHLLPVTRTSSPIDPDLVQDISRDSVRESLSLILDELGTGLAARGSDLGAVIRRANPALAQTERVFRILASQRRTLARLATDSETVLGPLAKVRRQLAGFVAGANTTATASAARSAQLRQSIRLLPKFLGRLQPLMADLGELADQGTPLMRSLDSSATALDAQFRDLVPFARRARTALINLGGAAQSSRSHLVSSLSLARSLRALGDAAAPSSRSLAALTGSLQQTGALRALMSVLFYGASATNGFDSDGHYLRADAIFGSCTAYNPRSTPVPGCSSQLPGATAAVQRVSRTAAREAGALDTRSERTLLGYLLGGSGR